MNHSETQNALESLKSIETVLNSSHEIQFPWQILMVYGAIIGLIPTIESATSNLTFGSESLINSPILITLIHILFYGIVFSASKRAVIHFTGAWKDQSSHPLILEGVRTKRLVAVSIIISMISFSYLEQTQFIYPVTLLLFGILFHEFAKFSRGPLVLLSWYSTGLGAAYFFLLKNYSSESLWRGTTWIWSIGFIATSLGLLAIKKREKSA